MYSKRDPKKSYLITSDQSVREVIGPGLKTREAAEYLGVSYSALCKWRMTGLGPPFVRVGPRRVVYRQGDLDIWMNERIAHSTSEY